MMSARRLGRLLGSLLSLATLAVLFSGALGSDMHTDDFEWTMSVTNMVVP
jgi:hypothetical protein